MAEDKMDIKEEGGEGDVDSLGEVKEEQKTSLTSGQFPPPPVFYKSYGPQPATTSQENGEGVDSINQRRPHPQALSLSPPRIPETSYQLFGEEWSVTEAARTLKEEGRVELFDNNDIKEHKLKGVIGKLLKASSKIQCEILETFADPKKFNGSPEMAKKLDDHYINILYLINQYRPQQAREILINNLQDQINARKQSAARLRELVKQGREKINGISEKIEIESALSESTREPIKDDVDNGYAVQPAPTADTIDCEDYLRNLDEEFRMKDDSTASREETDRQAEVEDGKNDTTTMDTSTD